jgi:hypothetical protein
MKESPEISEFTKIMKVSLSLNNNKFYELMGFLRFIGVEDIETLQLLTVKIYPNNRKFQISS